MDSFHGPSKKWDDAVLVYGEKKKTDLVTTVVQEIYQSTENSSKCSKSFFRCIGKRAWPKAGKMLLEVCLGIEK